MKKDTLAEISIYASCLFYAFTSITVKYISSECSGLFISLARFIVGAAATYGLIIYSEKKLQVKDVKSWLLRGVFGALAMITGYIAIKMTSSGRAVLLVNTYPVFVALFGALFFKERIGQNNLFALVFCLAGVFLVFHDKSHYSFWGNMLALVSGIVSGLAVHFIRRARQQNSPASVYLSACLFGLLASGAAAPEAAKVSRHALPFLLLIGSLALIGQILMTYGFKYVPATKGSVIGFLETILTILLSFLLLGEEMRPNFWAGTVFIILGLLINQKLFIPIFQPGLSSITSGPGYKSINGRNTGNGSV